MDYINDLVDFWFNNPDIWFGCDSDVDNKIKNQYGFLLGMEMESTDDPRYNLGLILLWDQVSRHVYRHDKIQIVPFHQQALVLSTSMLNRNDDLLFNSDERCFLLMPLRHTFDPSRLEYVIDKIKWYIKADGLDGFNKYKRFYRATLLSYSKLITQSICPESVDNSITDEDIIGILDKNSPTIFYNNNNNNKNIKNNKLYKAFDSLLSTQKVEGITLSISGGVDSMTCSYILSQLSQKYKIKIIAVMVNYNNRSECNIETQFVTRWLKSLGIDVYIRHIKYLKRKNEDDPIDRNFYEDVTKEFRFDLYRRFGYPVVLGHNKDDSIENIFTNIRKGRNYDNLLGMSNISVVSTNINTNKEHKQNNIIIYRPLLEIPKSEIYTFASNYSVPYLLDSTPKWSDRGKMRDELIPFLNEFDGALIPGLISLSNNMTELSKMEQILVKQFTKRFVFGLNVFGLNTGTVDVTEDEKNLGYSFWKLVIKHVTDNFKIKMCSNKSIISLTKLFKNNGNNITLSKQLKMENRGDMLTFILI